MKIKLKTSLVLSNFSAYNINQEVELTNDIALELVNNGLAIIISDNKEIKEEKEEKEEILKEEKETKTEVKEEVKKRGRKPKAPKNEKVGV